MWPEFLADIAFMGETLSPVAAKSGVQLSAGERASTLQVQQPSLQSPAGLVMCVHKKAKELKIHAVSMLRSYAASWER